MGHGWYPNGLSHCQLVPPQDPLIVPDVEPSAEQVLQADRELARAFLAMFKKAMDAVALAEHVFKKKLTMT